MFTISIQSNLDQLISKLDGLSSRRINSIVAATLTATAAEVQKEFKTQAASVFDRPKPFTINSTFISRATAQTLSARVGFKNEASGGRGPGRYLEFEILGGKRTTKAYERLLQSKGFLPSGWVTEPGPAARLDSYGNISSSLLSQILIAIRSGQADTPTTLRTKAKGKAQKAFFIVSPGQYTPQTAHLSPGIYQTNGGRGLLKVMNFISPPSYRLRMDLEKIGQRVVDQHFARLFNKYADASIARKLAEQT